VVHLRPTIDTQAATERRRDGDEHAVAPDPLTRRVKLADLADNLANNRRLPPDPHTRARIARYERAIASLRAVDMD